MARWLTNTYAMHQGNHSRLVAIKHGLEQLLEGENATPGQRVGWQRELKAVEEAIAANEWTRRHIPVTQDAP